ncbi:Uncharacterized protein GBIM_00676 [Gryllus bimaculatus]|nr:Uncharacterized protein GBIM_00676 [Gryllus bimaculatus]
MQDESEGQNAFWTERNILSLSDEVLVNICTYLTSEAAVSLSCTCKRFNDLLCERKLIRCINLRASYSVSLDLMKTFFRPFARCERVETINLTSCYWLTSGEILWILQRLTNLKNLHVNDTTLSVEHLTHIMKNIQSVSTYRTKSLPLNFRGWTFTQKLNFPNINSLILNMPPFVPHYLREVWEACDRDIAWSCLWIHYARILLDFRHTPLKSTKDLYALSFNLKHEEIMHLLKLKSLRSFRWLTKGVVKENYETLLRKSNIVHLFWESDELPRSLPEGLQYLKISATCMLMNSSPRSLLLYDALSHLTVVSVPACVLLSSVPGCSSDSISHEGETSQKKSARQSHLGKTTNADCFLKSLVENAPNLQTLEMKCKRGCTFLAPNESVNLGLINWPQLESLIMENIPLFDLAPLLKVCANCPKLRCLGLKYVGISGTFSQTWKLVQCINLLKNLEDFQFVHPDVNQLMTLIDALSRCPKLSRVSIICESTRASQNISSYLKLIEKCSYLVFLFVCVGAVTKKMEKDFQKEVKAKFLNERKYLWALLQGALRDDIVESIPFIHYLEMLHDGAQIPFLKD